MITRGVAEMARLGEAAGARVETFAGLAGMGDLMVTCWSKLGRNRRAGELIARGMSAEEAVAEIGQVVEGINTAAPLRDLARRLSVDLPITEAVCSVLGGESLTDLIGPYHGPEASGRVVPRREVAFALYVRAHVRLHVRVGHRGASGQDRRPDLRLGAGRGAEQ